MNLSNRLEVIIEVMAPSMILEKEEWIVGPLNIHLDHWIILNTVMKNINTSEILKKIIKGWYKKDESLRRINYSTKRANVVHIL